ncbi:RhoGAP-domain-containing protein [Hysterangium stoloniferum]|nr:RhoGAP-domain-containing protein [Hysterangium stoloniferum]
MSTGPTPTSQQSMDSVYSRASYTTTNRPLASTSPPQPSNESSPYSAPQASLKPDSPPPIAPRLSSESANKPSSSRWQDEIPTIERRDTVASIPSYDAASIMENFDDNVLRALCDLDCGVPLLLDRIKQSMVSCREAAVFFKKRSTIEEEYSKNMQKLARISSEVYAMNDGKAGSFVNAWQASMHIHEVIAENRSRFAQRLSDISEELNSLAKHVDKGRKETKELAGRYERLLVDSEMSLEKAKVRHDSAAEELERLVLQKEGESYKDTGVQNTRSPGGKRVIGKAVAKGGLLLKGKNPANLQRQEDDVRTRMSTASNAMSKALQETQAIRQEYFNLQLPRILRNLKEHADEIDNGLQYHLGRYAFLFESLIQTDGSSLIPLEPEATGLRGAIDLIDNRADFRVYMQNYAVAHTNTGQRGLRREGPWQEGFVMQAPAQADKPIASSSQPPNFLGESPVLVSVPEKGTPTFGIDLAEQMTRDAVEVPRIMQKCCEAIEKYGMRSKGIYRISGTHSKIQKLKEKLDRDVDSVDLNSTEWTSDINNVTSVLKLWLRELPEPLLTHSLHQGFIEAAKLEVPRMRHIRLHERVNDLPDANYATLKYFLGHLHKISVQEADNQMTIFNLAVVFGPTLFGISGSSGASGVNGMADATWQNRAIETVLEHYADIFVDEGTS